MSKARYPIRCPKLASDFTAPSLRARLALSQWRRIAVGTASFLVTATPAGLVIKTCTRHRDASTPSHRAQSFATPPASPQVGSSQRLPSGGAGPGR